MKANGGDRWGFYNVYSEKGLQPFSIAVGNHDTQPLRQIAMDIPDNIESYRGSHKPEALRALAEEFHMDIKTLEDPKEFVTAKWADTMLSRNNHMFYMDVFGRSERFNQEIGRTKGHFSYKIPANFEDSYIKGIQEGFGFNPMAALERLFKLDGREKRYPELFGKIKHFGELLLAPEPKAIIDETTKAASSSGNKRIKTALLIGISFAAGIIGGFCYKNSTEKSSSAQIVQQQTASTSNKSLS